MRLLEWGQLSVPGTSETRKLLVSSLDSPLEGFLLSKLLVHLLLLDAALVLEQSFGEGMVFPFNSVVFPLSNGDVERPGTNTLGRPLLLVDSWTVDRTVLALGDVHKLV